ncbi:MAG: hypothetical protein K0Q89_12 [Thermomicrobiales bacterium]|jgi:hypothetical protein|nr:hypothetical protein [Thermomicrobiales bacterium]
MPDPSAEPPSDSDDEAALGLLVAVCLAGFIMLALWWTMVGLALL